MNIIDGIVKKTTENTNKFFTIAINQRIILSNIKFGKNKGGFYNEKH